MSAPDLTPEDTAAMRKTPGDFREYLRSEMARGAARREKPRAAGRAPAPPGRRPGGWPPGTRPPDPPPEIPAAEVAHAVQEHRDWVAAGRPPGQYRCECQPCQITNGGNQ